MPTARAGFHKSPLWPSGRNQRKEAYEPQAPRHLRLVAKPGHGDEAKKYLGEWLRSLVGSPGYLGGSVLEEVAGELLPDTLVVTMEFESTHAARAFWPTIAGTVNPLDPDDKTLGKLPDQGIAFFDGTKDAVAAGGELPLKFTRGDGLFARMLHVHAAVVEEVSASA
jgi:hypothetical protein